MFLCGIIQQMRTGVDRAVCGAKKWYASARFRGTTAARRGMLPSLVLGVVCAPLAGLLPLLQVPILLSVLKTTITYTWWSCIILSAANVNAATPAINGQSGYINMPSARVEADGTFSAGYSFDQPYGSLWMSSTMLPFLQVTGRFVSVNGIAGFSNVAGEYGSEYGRFKDKVIDAKVRLWDETAMLPSVAVGTTDLFGTTLFKGRYVVATKTFGAAKNIEASVGYGRTRPDGLFAGARWTPVSKPNWALVAEYDANDYPKDFRAAETDAGVRRKGPSVALEYRWGWLGAQLARHRDHFSANLYASIPLSEREFIPKIFEPAYYKPSQAPARAAIAQWRADPSHAQALVAALVKQDFKNVRVALDGGMLHLQLTNSRISNMGRAVGRAARTALAFAPLGTRSLKITYTRLEQPLATYEFLDMASLSDYLTGLTRREAFLQTVLVRYANDSDRIDDDHASMTAAVVGDGSLGVHVGRDGNVVQLSSEDREDNRFKLTPKVGFFFNDPSGALRYDASLSANYDKRLARGLYLNSALRLSVFENISGVTQESNSLLPHVRTDVAEYKRGGRFKLNKLMVNQYFAPAEHWYARLSGGFYEEMYRGVGGQILHLPKDARWAADLSVDALQQRGFKGWFDKRDYQTVTALGALHYRLPYDFTGTVRAGRFLARDTGARFELKRRFRSGVELGVWYTHTNGNDITSPGSVSSPYRDKGVFLSIPLNSMLPMDSQGTAGFSLAPWTRDVGQMVASPGDLYDLMENSRRDLSQHDGLGNFAERADEQKLDAVAGPVRAYSPWPGFRHRLQQAAGNGPPLSSWAYGGAMAAGAIVGSALVDKPVDRYLAKHQDSRLARGWGNFGKNMPIALVGLSGAAVALGDDRMQNTGIIALQSVAGAVGVSTLGKYIVSRARPEEERGSWARSGEGVSRANSAFPSVHAAAAFAAVTPFAQEYDAPWLYGVATVASMGRVANRKHWVSDTVTGGIAGYAIGSILWKAQRDQSGSRLSIMPGPKEISVAWQTVY